MKKIFAIYDIVAQEIHGPLMTFNSETAAIRMFTELALDKNTLIARNTKDFKLLYMGMLDEETPAIHTTGNEEVITGEQWLAAQEKNTGA